MIRVEVTVVAGRIDDPLMGYQKIVMVPLRPDERDDSSAILDVTKAITGALVEAKESIDGQAAWHAAGGGT